MHDLTSRRFDRFICLLLGIMFGIMLGLMYCTWMVPYTIDTPEEYAIQYAGKTLKPDAEAPKKVDPEKQICECVSFVDDEDKELGILCRCDIPDEPILWFFEGSSEGLTQLYLYLDEGVKEYYDQLQEKRWPREGLPEGPDFSEEPFEREL